MRKKLLGVLLALSLIGSSLTAAAAEANPAETVVAQETEETPETESTEETEEISGTGVWVNPAYRDTYTEEDVRRLLADREEPEEELVGAAPVLASREEAVAYLTQQMKNRMVHVELQWSAGEGDMWALLEEAMQESANTPADEGDYIRANTIGHGYSWSSDSCSFDFVYTSDAAQEAAVNTAVANAIAALKLSGKSDVEKIRLIYDYIVDHVTYEDDDTYLCHSTYAAIVKGKAVCQGYASLFHRMCKEAGLEVRYITGMADGGPHAWNIVKVGGLWYNADSTWEEKGSRYYRWLLKSDQDFIRHDRDENYAAAAFYTAHPMADTSYSMQDLFPDAKQVGNCIMIDGRIMNVSEKLKEARSYRGWQFSDLSLNSLYEEASQKNTGIVISAAATNNTGSDQSDATLARLILLDEDGQEKLNVNILLSPAKEGESVNVMSTVVLSDMPDFSSEQFADCALNAKDYIILFDGEEYHPAVTYTVTFDAQGGSAVSAIKGVEKGSAVQLPSAPKKEGYVFDGWYTGPDGAGTRCGSTLTVTENITLYAFWKFAQTPWPFTDVAVDRGGWKYESVKYVYENNIMNGIKKDGKITTFEPDSPLNRGMFATVLYRMAGSPAVTYEAKFSDVPKGQYYSNAVIWARQKGIVKGYDDGRFGVNDDITREQIAKMLMEYAQMQGYDISARADLNSFPDKNKVSGWATNYMRWAVGAGMVNGKKIGGTYYLDPQGKATRAECAAMLMRFLRKYE